MATNRSLCSSTGHSWPPTDRGQKYRNCLSAAEWKVRACTPGTPRDRSRTRISPAARVVKVTASTSEEECAPSPIRWAIRWVMVRVLPVPAPARTQTGPDGATTAER